MGLRERWCAGAMRLEVLLVSLGVVLLVAPSAGAALKKYGIARQLLNHFSNTSPQASFLSSGAAGSVALIDDSGAGPELRKLVLATDFATTVDVPALTNGFIHVRPDFLEGFEPSTGTGDSNTSINWGNLDGWTISGSYWCHSVPSFVCDLASVQDSQTVDPQYLSSNYDVGTWTFHGTGWTVNLGYIWTTSTSVTGFGNTQFFLRGARVFDGTVPALPLIGIGAVGLSVVALGAASMRHRRPSRRASGGGAPTRDR